MIVPKDVFVAGNQLITRRGDTYGYGKECGDAVCEVPNPDKRKSLASDDDANIVIVDPQSLAVDNTFRIINARVRNLLLAHFDQNQTAATIIKDQYAIFDIAKTGRIDGRFVKRFQEASGRSPSDTASLFQEVAVCLEKIKADVALTLQVDHSGSLRHYLQNNVYGEIGEILKEQGLVYDSGATPSEAGGIYELITRLGYEVPQNENELQALKRRLGLTAFLNDRPMSKTAVTRAFDGAASRFVRLPLHLFEPEIAGLTATHMDMSIFNVSDIMVEPERFMRDAMQFEADRLDWDSDGINFTDDGSPYHSIRNVFVANNHGKLEAQCLGVVAGTFVRLASRYPGSTVHYTVQEDLRNYRVEDDIIRAGIEFFRKKWLMENPNHPITIKYRMLRYSIESAKS